LFKGGAAILADSQNADIIVLSVGTLKIHVEGSTKLWKTIKGSEVSRD
jgi:hypothetical protein